ncbi:MAG: hypothetical protein JO034_07335 [Singulisphaera sp.]|nr:hypothetical protein [Singulisphaera sp.]
MAHTSKRAFRSRFDDLEGRRLLSQVTLPETSIAGPALASNGGDLFIAWTGTDAAHSLNVEDLTLGNKFPFRRFEGGPRAARRAKLAAPNRS